MPRNAFKTDLTKNRTQLGLWCTLSNSFAVEVVAGAGYDWLLLDTEQSWLLDGEGDYARVIDMPRRSCPF